MYHIFFIHSSVEGHLGWFHSFTLLVELQIGIATLESSVENPQKTWNGPSF